MDPKVRAGAAGAQKELWGELKEEIRSMVQTTVATRSLWTLPWGLLYQLEPSCVRRILAIYIS